MPVCTPGSQDIEPAIGMRTGKENELVSLRLVPGRIWVKSKLRGLTSNGFMGTSLVKEV